MLVVLSLVYPALSQGPADLNTVPAQVRLDWFYLGAYPLLDRVSGLALWAFFVGGTLVLFCLPWLPWKRRRPAAAVDLDNCNGCGRCYADCPYSAISMDPRSDGEPYEREAVVHASKCNGCGICVGACPTATPFRRASELIPGIDRPDVAIREVRDQSVSASAALTGDDRVLVYGCHHGPDLTPLKQAGAAVIRLPCVSELPPSFLDFVINRGHADGVLLTGCREGDCYHRLGIDWMEQRIAGQRDPYLRKRVPRERIARVWSGLISPRALVKELDAFRTRLRAMGPLAKAGAEPDKQPVLEEG